jgi:cyclic pyranopterin phosphate synthase
MPLDAEHHWERAKVAPAHVLHERINEVFALEPIAHGPEPATSYRFADGSPGGVGFIGSVTEPFCETCNRLRLTSEGQLRACLFALDETDLREPLRSGADDEALASLIRDGVAGKWAGHRINHPDFVRPDKSMSMIGG